MTGQVSGELRARLTAVADVLIPAAHGMPAASAVDVGGAQLDAVLRSRPDLAAPLSRALATPVREDVEAWMAGLAGSDPDAHHALTVVVLAAYYWADEVCDRLGYPGQTASVVAVGYPAYVEEGLLDAMLEQGPRYREPPAEEGPT